MRAFIAIDVPEQLRSKLVRLQSELPQANIKKVEPENIHITLKFLGDIDEAQLEKVSEELARLVQRYSPFKVSVRGIGFFPNQNFIRVVWVGCEAEDDRIVSLAEEINGSLKRYGFSPEHDFTPHLTLARVKSKADFSRFYHTHSSDEFGEFIADSVVIYESRLSPTGPIYTELKRFKFGG